MLETTTSTILRTFPDFHAAARQVLLGRTANTRLGGCQVNSKANHNSNVARMFLKPFHEFRHFLQGVLSY